MPGFIYGFDIYYFILIVPAILLSLWAQVQVKSAYNKYAKVTTSRGMTGAEAAEAVLRQNGVRGVRIERVSGQLTDHFDPRSNVIRLSDGVYDSKSVAAAGIAAHEAGHAVQYAEEYTPIRLRMAIIPITQFGSMLAWPLILISFFIESVYSNMLFAIGAVLFSAVVLFQLITLPVELNASKRAIGALESGQMLSSQEVPGAKKVLRAAALTYVAALAVAAAQLLRILLLRQSRRRH
ncbi:MAG TPA: zinc metallopeptidase [Clostridiales bacterium]|jgi:Zn-dependent membrane protease YugP|nr:zinc metallopeptidase [Clostridiales bacterium]